MPPGKRLRYANGDIVAVLRDEHNFGLDELSVADFDCVEVVGMSFEEAVEISREDEPIEDAGPIIGRPLRSFVDLADLLPADYSRQGVHQVTRDHFLTKLQSRDIIADQRILV